MPQDWVQSSGIRVLTVSTGRRATLLAIDRRAAAGFDTYLLDRMEELFTGFLASEGRPPSGKRKS